MSWRAWGVRQARLHIPDGNVVLRPKGLRSFARKYKKVALYHLNAKALSRGVRSTVRAVAYRSGCELRDERTGELFDYRDKEVIHVELVVPKDSPAWMRTLQQGIVENREKGVQALVDIVEAAEKRIDARVWREVEFALHRELTPEQNRALAREFVEDQIVSKGMCALLNFHVDTHKETGEKNPHCHVLLTTRPLEEHGFSAKKERAWNDRSFIVGLREQWAAYSNYHLKLNGHDVQIDHRSYKERGIEMEPQPKRGRAIVEIDEKGKNYVPPFIADKTLAFQEVQLRNLYRIMRRPEVVFDIVSKHHATFMWGDVQQVLHRYIDDLPLFQRLEARLKNSSELLLLRPGEGEGKDGDAIYTTRSLLKAERALVGTAERLSASSSHGVDEAHVEASFAKANEDLKDLGGNLSADQTQAVRHLIDSGQLKCVVGIAGAGKTTALGIAKSAWDAQGYNVVGLAPTGKAAQNLEQSGITSMTLHKFLQNVEAGWSHYKASTILILDEAGMVDVERFSDLLSTVKKLGVKLVVVGDGAQLQPVEAGPAFRLITERVGMSELNTVLRQKESWQREATMLFGKQKTEAALQQYVTQGHVQIVQEEIPSLTKALLSKDAEMLVYLHTLSKRMGTRLYREMIADVEKQGHNKQEHVSHYVRQHQDHTQYLKWKSVEKATSTYMDPNSPQIDLRTQTKETMLTAWHAGFKLNPEQKGIMLAFTNKDVADLNTGARYLLKQSGHLPKEESLFTVKQTVEDDFGRQTTTACDKAFSKGDRIVFTRNDRGLGVKNGTVGIITDLTVQVIQVKLDGGPDAKIISFAPNLNPFFDHGWAITIHKSQGTTVDKAYVLASYEMSQNLAYVAMTRHREKCQVFGSSLDFWRPEKFHEVLSKSGDKLSSGHYLEAPVLEKLMHQDDRTLTKLFTRMSDELQAMGAVSKEAFWRVASKFGIIHDREAPETPQRSIREEARAERLFNWDQRHKFEDLLPTLKPEKSHEAFLKPQNPTGIREVIEKPLSTELLKEIRPSSKEVVQEEAQQQKADQTQQDRQAKQLLEAREQQVQKERSRVKQRDLSM